MRNCLDNCAIIVQQLRKKTGGPGPPVDTYGCPQRGLIAALFLLVTNEPAGNAAKRAADARADARVAAGKRASNQAKLTAEQAREIRESLESGPVLALRYGVNKSLINNIKRGEAWRVYASPFAGLGARV